MSIGRMAYFKYYVMQVERHLGPGIDNIIEIWNRPSCQHMRLIQASSTELEAKEGQNLMMTATRILMKMRRIRMETQFNHVVTLNLVRMRMRNKKRVRRRPKRKKNH